MSSDLISKLFPLTPSPVLTGSDYLNPKHFRVALGVALAIHLVALGIWMMMPKMQVIDIPVRVLNIKLGDGDITAEELQAAQPNAPNSQNVENTISHLVRDQDPVLQARTNSMVGSIDKLMKGRDLNPKVLDKAIGDALKQPEVARQFVRTTGSEAIVKPQGGSARDAEMISRYEQVISLWIQKFKIYPNEARTAGMQGETVVRIRIDRQGTIRYYILERSTGFEVLDRSAIDMIRRANPVPAVPQDYPPGDLIEFLIPVNFHLQ